MTRFADKYRRWRVRLWIRIAVVVGLMLLAAEQADVVRRVERGEMPASELRDGYFALAGYAAAGWLLAASYACDLGERGAQTSA